MLEQNQNGRTMKFRNITVFVCSLFVAIFSAYSQEDFGHSRIDTLIGKMEYASAYKLAQEQWRQSQQSDGAAQLKAAFYLTAIDYAYSKTPEDSALMRYSGLAHRLKGAEQAVAYAFLFQTYKSIYAARGYTLAYNKPSDDKALGWPQWHTQRMVDSLTACVDSIMAKADLLRTTSAKGYRWLSSGEDQIQPMDTSLMGMMVQMLIGTERYYANSDLLNESQRAAIQQPLTLFLKNTSNGLPYPFSIHRLVASAFAESAADQQLWIDLRRLETFGFDSSLTEAVENLEHHYWPLLKSDEMKAWLKLCRAICLYKAERRVESEQLCLETERLYPDTWGANECRKLRDDICRAEIKVSYNTVESSRRSRLACVEARNVDTLTFRIVPKESVPDSLIRNRKTDTLRVIPAIAEWRQALPGSSDRLMHRHLVALPPLPQGDYYLVALSDSNYSHNELQSADAEFITYSDQPSGNRHTQMTNSSGYLIDRVTGQPLPNRRVTLHLEGPFGSRDYKRRYRTDSEGYFSFPTTNARYLFKYPHNITADIDGYEYEYPDRYRYGIRTYNEWDRKSKHLDIIMTDRPIYRLGDTVRFACIAYSKKRTGDTKRETLKPKAKLKLVALLEQDYTDTKDTIMLTTDQYGRCWGEFVIPTDGHNGEYTLSLYEPSRGSWAPGSYTDSRTITVSAYKPPRFAVTLSNTAADADSTANTVRRFGKPITIYGTVISYSGAPMTGARVKWEVSREKMRDPFQAYSVADEYPFFDSLEVDSNGLFQFTFTPERTKADKNEDYIYTAYVLVLDADGEQREQQLAFHVSDADGYCSLGSDDLSHLAFAYNNFDHQPLKGAVRVQLYQLRQPDTLRMLDPIMQEYPDAKWIGTREEFRRTFPHLAYTAEEADKRRWPTVATRCDQTTEERQINIAGLPSSLYRLCFTAPDGRQYDTVVNYVAPGGRVTGDDIVWVRSTPKRRYEYEAVGVKIGDTIRLELGSPFGNQPLYYSVSSVAKVYRRGMMVLDSSHTSTLVIPVVDEMENGITVTLTAMRNSRVFNHHYRYIIARPDRWLNVGIETFRDHLHPGEKEQWHLQISNADTSNGKTAKGVEANLCLTLFDKSLDEFARDSYLFWPWGINYAGTRATLAGSRMNKINFNSPHVVIKASANNSRPEFGPMLPVSRLYCHQMRLSFNPGRLNGTVVDSRDGEPLISANIVLRKKGEIVTGARTDFDGNFSIINVPEGSYDLEVSYMGYNTQRQRITIRRDERLRLHIALTRSGVALKEVQIKASKIPVLGVSAPEHGRRLEASDIARMPGSSDEIVAAVAGVGYARGEEGMVTQQGNVRKRTGVNVPKEAIAEIQTLLQFDGSTGERPMALRKNLSTLAFFKPDLRSDKEGSIHLTFTMPDALAQWHLYGTAWTERFQTGNIDRTLWTQKELMVQPLLPRFLRQGDTTEIRAKVSNLTDSAIQVEVTLEIGNPATTGAAPLSAITVEGHSSAIAKWQVPVGDQWHTAEYKIYARTVRHTGGHLSDGEQGLLPVLPRRERIVVSHPLYVAGCKDSSQSATASFSIPIGGADSVDIAFNDSPIQYVIEALPHFERHRMPGNLYLANSIYVNNLKATIGQLTDKERKRISSHARGDLQKLLESQTSEQGWSWMPGGKKTNLNITASILERIVPYTLQLDGYYKRQLKKALSALDKAIVKQYSDQIQTVTNSRTNTFSHFRNNTISILYARSLYFGSEPLSKCDSATREAYDHYYRQCLTTIDDDIPLMCQGQLALLMQHWGDTASAKKVAHRLKESAHVDPQQGMYWVKNTSGYGWYQRPVETASLLVDVFADILHDWESANRIQQWILTAKQGTTWKSDMATAYALSALLRQPTGSVRQGKATIVVDTLTDSQINTLTNSQIDTLVVRLDNPTPYPAWGAVFCSSELPIDSIPANGSGISLRKTISLVAADGSQHLLQPGMALRIGDRVRVHIDIHCQRDLDNMVLTDQRAAAFEPVSTASGWRWCHGDGGAKGFHYYTDVRDDALNCYIDHLAEGHYYVEYDLWVRNAGTFAGGIGSLRSVYAPEFRANTTSTTIRIVD